MSGISTDIFFLDAGKTHHDENFRDINIDSVILPERITHEVFDRLKRCVNRLPGEFVCSVPPNSWPLPVTFKTLRRPFERYGALEVNQSRGRSGLAYILRVWAFHFRPGAFKQLSNVYERNPGEGYVKKRPLIGGLNQKSLPFAFNTFFSGASGHAVRSKVIRTEYTQ